MTFFESLSVKICIMLHTHLLWQN